MGDAKDEANAMGSAFAWKGTDLEAVDDLPNPGEEGSASPQTSPKTAPSSYQEPAVNWPPTAPLPEEKGGSSGATSTARGFRGWRKGAKEKSETAPPPPPGPPPQAARAGQKREDGWLPKAEYEAKKREERSRQKGEGGKGGKKGKGKGKDAGAGSLQGSGRGWDFEIPKKPDPKPETEEMRKAREAEDAAMKCREQLRNASMNGTADELRAAIAAAKELGLKEEVKLGEKKLEKLQG